MKKSRIAIIIIALIIAVFTVNSFTARTYAADITQSGTSGTVSWELDSDGVLHIFPTDGVSGTLENISYWGSVPWLNYSTNIIKIEIAPGVHANTNACYLFSNLRNLIEIEGIENLDLSQTTNISQMFYNAQKLKSLDLSSCDLSNITDAEEMFYNTYELRTINLTGVQFSNLTNARSMFAYSGVRSLDLSVLPNSPQLEFNDGIVGCSGLRYIDLTPLDPSIVQRIGWSNKITAFKVQPGTVMGSKNYSLLGGNTWNNIEENKTMLNPFTNDPVPYGGTYVANHGISWNIYQDGTLIIRTRGIWDGDVSQFNDVDYGQTIHSGVIERAPSLSPGQEWLQYVDDISAVSFEGLVAPSSMTGWFRDFPDVPIDWEGLDTRWTSDMWELFRDSSFTSLDLSSLTTDQLSGHAMQAMFFGCNNLMELTLGSKWSYIDPQWALDFFTSGGMYDENIFVPPEGYSRKWIREDGSLGPYTPEELAQYYPLNAETWAGKWVRAVADDRVLIHYDANGGITTESDVWITSPATSTVIPGETNTTRPLYYLDSWNTEPDGSGTSYQLGEEATFPYGQRVTLYAQWVLTPEGVSYYVRHYQQDVSDPENYTLVETERLFGTPGRNATPAVKSYEYYISPPEQTLTVVEDMVVDYYYDREHYKIVFDGNGSTSGYMANEDFFIGINKTLTQNAYEKDHCVFLNWNTNADGTGTTYIDAQSINLDVENDDTITLYAQWQSLETTTIPSSGEVTVSIKSGETIVFPELPAGITYSIEEVDIPDGWTNTEGTNKSGTIPINGEVASVFTNRYATSGTAMIQAHKSLVGNTVMAGQFEFRLFDENGQLIDTVTNGSLDQLESYTDDQDQTVVNQWYLTAPVNFNALTYTEPGEYHYTITEVSNNDPSIVYDSHTENVTVNAIDNGDGTMTCQVIYDRDGALFTNRVKTGSLTVHKNVENGTTSSSNAVFSFTVGLSDSSGAPLTGNYPVIKSDGTTATVANGESVTIGGGESFEIRDLPHGAAYTVAETDVPGFTLTSAENSSGTIDVSTSQPETVFTNEYNATGSIQISATKQLENGTLEPNTFQFELTDASGAVIDTQYADESGNISFGSIYYGPADNGNQYTYYISEVKGDDSNVVYDEHVETVTVSVADNGSGNMVADVVYDNDGAVFHNELITSNIKHNLTLSKEVTSTSGNTSGEFSFTVEIGSDTYDITLKHGDSRTFNNIPVGTAYTITENNASPANVKFTNNGVVTDGTSITGTITDETGDVNILCTNKKRVIIIVPTNVTTRNIVVAIMIICSLSLASVYGYVQKRKKHTSK